MKVRRFSYKLFNLKIAIFLLFFHFSIPIYVMARDRKCNILENARQLVFQKGEGSEDAKLMLLRLDSLINSDVVPENIYVQAVLTQLLFYIFAYKKCVKNTAAKNTSFCRGMTRSVNIEF